MNKKRAMSSEKASYVKRKGHEDAEEFAILLGIGKEFKRDPRAKKDVIDYEGRAYSIKGGEKKWQIFLYGKKRFENDKIFKGINRLGEIFIKCIESFPENRQDYLNNKRFYKEQLRSPMKELCKELNNPNILGAFLEKAIFNGAEVDFLVIKENNEFHVFWREDVISVLSNAYKVENSKARNAHQVDEQKVVFKVEGKTHGEIEMRTDSDIHYREVKFWLHKGLTFNLLISKITPKKQIKEKIFLYGDAIKKLKYLK